VKMDISEVEAGMNTKAILKYCQVCLGAFGITCLAAALMTETGRTAYGIFAGLLSLLVGLVTAAYEEN